MKITLLDGKEWDKKELLEKASDDDFYYNYLGRYAFSSTSIKNILSSPKTYSHILRYGSEESQALRDGWLMHTCLLENEVFEKQIFVDVQSKNTKKYKEAKKEYGKVFTIKEKRSAERLTDALLRNDMVIEKMKGTEFEVAEVGEIFGFPFRAKADVLRVGSDIYDIKSTSALEGWKYSADKWGYDIQCYIYCTLWNIKPTRMGFIIIDKGSLDIGYAPATIDFYLRGRDKLQKALRQFERCFMDPEFDLDQYYLEIEL